MVFVFELGDESPSLDPAGLPDSLSPIQRAWLLKSIDDEAQGETSNTSTTAHNTIPNGIEDSSSEKERLEIGVDEGLGGANDDDDDIVGLNMNSFSACLCCYPIVSQLASELDLNSLDSLSRTCKQFRATLLLFRDQLVTRTLRCSNEELDEEKNNTNSESAHSPIRAGNRWTRGKVGKCARDLVGECKRCGKIVCRNCIAKPPPDPQLPKRLRRLCPTCLKAPLISHMDNSSPSPILSSLQRRSSVSLISRTPTPSSMSSSCSFISPKEPPMPFAAKAFLRAPCICTQNVHVCAPCGSSLLLPDKNYAFGLTWRRQYGGFLSGVSEGHKGLPCGKGDKCLAARCVEREVEVDTAEYYASSGSETDHEHHHSITSSTTLGNIDEGSASVGRSWSDGGFMAQEVEGIGGAVKMKKRQFIRVGAEVDEDEESESDASSSIAGSLSTGISAAAAAKYLKKEKSGERRSFCAWCERIVPSVDDGWAAGGV